MQSEAGRFLETLFAAKPDDLYVLIWTRQGADKRSRWFRDVRRAAAYVDSLLGCDVYVGVGLSPSDFGEFKRCESENIAGMCGLCVDIDLKSEAHPKGARPERIEQALSILPPEFPPSIIVETGNGIQVWWLFKELLIFENVAERQEGAAISSRWQTLVKYEAQRHGWAFERLGDLARVLRVPGTQNLKDPVHTKNVVMRAISDQRYNPSDFRSRLDDLSIPSDDQEAREAKKGAEEFSDTPLVISLNAAIREESLTRWMEEDSKFRSTWNHERVDITDVSQSGHDLALACFAVRKGLGDQQSVDLIIHNRRLHGARQSKSLDYYRRTISKARNGVGGQFLAAANEGTPDPSVPDATGEPASMACRAPDPNEKAKLCDRISGILGIQILRIEKLTASEPMYFVELESGCVEFSCVGKLLSHKFVKEAIAAKSGKLIRKFSGKPWDQIAQMMLDACVEKEGTDDLEFKGAARIYITKYLPRGSPQIRPMRIT